MIGILYIATSVVSHVGAKIKEGVWNLQAKVNAKSNTYTDYYGNTRDASTNKQVVYSIEDNNDHVLYDTHHRVIRNISQEERDKEWIQKRNEPGRDKLMETVLATNELRTIKIRHPHYGYEVSIRGKICRDLNTGCDYFRVIIPVGDADKYFYVSVDNPFDLIRITDEQKKIEKITKNNGKYNWLDHPHDEKVFITEYNKRPFVTDEKHNICHIKSMSIQTF